MSASETTGRPPPGNAYVPYYMIVFLFVLTLSPVSSVSSSSASAAPPRRT